MLRFPLSPNGVLVFIGSVNASSLLIRVQPTS